MKTSQNITTDERDKGKVPKSQPRPNSEPHFISNKKLRHVEWIIVIYNIKQYYICKYNTEIHIGIPT